MMWGDGGWYWGFGALHMLLYWGILILIIAALAKWLFGGAGGHREQRGRALEILKERYARGEIGKDEFEQKRRDVQS